MVKFLQLTTLVLFALSVVHAHSLDTRWGDLPLTSQDPLELSVDAAVSLADAETLLESTNTSRASRAQLFHEIGERHLLKTGNTHHAANFLRASAALGNSNAQFLVGALVATNGTIPGAASSAAAESTLFYHFASQGGSVAASLVLGYRHLHGYGTPRSCSTALRHYKVAVDDVMRHKRGLPNPNLPIQYFSSPQATRLNDDQHKLPSTDDDERQSVDYLRQRASQSSNTELLIRTASLVLFSDLYQRGIPSDLEIAYKEAKGLLHQAATLGSGLAKALLGHVYAYGLAGSELDVDKAIQFYQDALNATTMDGHSEPASGLGLVYFHGLGSQPINYEQAMTLLQAAAGAGHADGVYNAALLLTHAKPQRSIEYLQAAADVGHVGAVFELARRKERLIFRGHQDNDHGEQDSRCRAVVELYRQVAGYNADGRELLRHAEQAFLEARYAHSLSLYLVAAEMGYQVAEHNAAWLLERYVFSTQKEMAGSRLYTRLVERGMRQQSADAFVQSGDLEFAQGKYAIAMERYVRAIRLDPSHPRALYSAGYMCEHGLGTAGGGTDLANARWYYKQAAQNEPSMAYVIMLLQWIIDTKLLVERIVEIVHAVVEAATARS